MKNGKLQALLNTPLGVVIVVGAVVLGVEFLFMVLLHEVLIPTLPFKLSDTAWDFIDAVTLTAVVSPVLYFLVFRKILEDEERFRQTLAAAPNAIVIVNGQGRITNWNHTAQKMFQWSREEAVGQQMHQLIAPPRYHADAVRGFARFEEIGAGPLIGKTTEISALRKDGSEFPVELSLSAVKLKGHWHAIGIIHDITERKQADHQKHLEEIRLRASMRLNSMVGADEKVILDFILEEGLRMTDSRYSFIGWINDDASVMTIHSWSSEVMKTCAVEQPSIKFPIDKAGIWAEPVRNRKAIIINDYAQPHPQKHGYPPGHVEIRRYLGVPVFDGDRVAMVVAVANKNLEYDESDVNALSSVMTDAWRVIQRNHSEQELRESEERFHHLFENMSSGVAIYQPDAACEVFTFKSLNRALERIERVRREEVLGRSVEDVFPGVRAFGLLEVFQRVCRSGEAEHIPPAFYQDERIAGWRENYVYRLDSGEVVVVYDDVTERKQADEELQLTHFALDHAIDSVFWMEPSGKFRYVNETACRMLGYSREELLTMGVADIDPNLPEGVPLEMSQATKKAGFGRVESEHRAKDGHLIPVEIMVAYLQYKGEKFHCSFVRDITERKNAEAAFHTLVATVARNIGAEFFRETVRSLSTWLGVECVIVGELVDGNRVRALAMQLDGKAVEHYEYPLAGTPCESATEKGYCEYHEGVVQLFPVDKDLVTIGAESYVGTPIWDKNGKVNGILCAISRHKFVPPAMTQGVFEIIAARAGVEIERKRMEKESLEEGIRTRDALEDAIGAIAATLEQRDPYTAGHQRRVAQLAAVIGEEMGLAREVIEGIHFGGLIHDIGKISVPAEILGKPGRLTDIEFGLIKTHAEAGYEIVKGIAFPWPVADMVRQHHERLDGSGYPQGLKSEQIVLEARILAVADVVEAMSANRPYRPGLGVDAALDEITRARGTQLDPVAVDACLRIIREKGFVFTK